jgi:hypothetical protein
MTEQNVNGVWGYKLGLATGPGERFRNFWHKAGDESLIPKLATEKRFFKDGEVVSVITNSDGRLIESRINLSTTPEEALKRGQLTGYWQGTFPVVMRVVTG